MDNPNLLKFHLLLGLYKIAFYSPMIYIVVWGNFPFNSTPEV